MATKYYTLCRHTGPAQPHGTSGKIVVPGNCPKCAEREQFNLSHRPETTLRITASLVGYRIKTTSR